MRRSGWILAVLIGVLPAVAQDFDDGRDLPPGALFAFGNLAVQEVVQANEPIEQLKAFFSSVNLRLSKQQERKVVAIVAEQRKELETRLAGISNDREIAAVTRKLNQEYVQHVNAILTADQQSAWRHHRIEQLRLRGGFPALQAILEGANVHLTEEQAKSIEKIFENFALRQAHLAESNQNPSIAEVDRLVIAEFNRVVALLTPEQRQALLASRSRRSAGDNRISSR
jgi:hypothetical protein